MKYSKIDNIGVYWLSIGGFLVGKFSVYIVVHSIYCMHLPNIMQLYIINVFNLLTTG